MKKVSIIIPAHNEEERIGRTLEEYGNFFEKLKKEGFLDFEIVVVLNACNDGTLSVVKKAKKKHKKIIILDFEKGGKGFALIEGFKDALKRENDLIGFVDADMATKPDAFNDLIKSIGNNGGAIASRWMKDSVIKTKQTILRRITSRGFNFIVKSLLLLPYTDTQCGAKLFRKESLKAVLSEIGTTEWAFDIDLLYSLKRKNIKVKEISTVWDDQTESQLNLIKTPFKMFASVVRLRLIFSPFRFIVKLYDKLPESIKIKNL